MENECAYLKANSSGEKILQTPLVDTDGNPEQIVLICIRGPINDY